MPLVKEMVGCRLLAHHVVAKLQDRNTLLCSRRKEKIITSKAAAKSEPPVEPTSSHVETFILLQLELTDNVHCLFVFVEQPEVEPTNNRSERNARREAEIRQGARTSKTDSGAKRRSIIVTVLASLQTRIARFTLANMLAEVGRWLDTGKSLFELELEAIQAKRVPPTETQIRLRIVSESHTAPQTPVKDSLAKKIGGY